MTNFEPLNKTKYSCDVYQIILTDKKPISDLNWLGKHDKRKSFSINWIKDSLHVKHKVGFYKAWEYRIFTPFNLNFLNWPNENPLEVKE